MRSERGRNAIGTRSERGRNAIGTRSERGRNAVGTRLERVPEETWKCVLMTKSLTKCESNAD
jgi:hypothetical protein